jgi:hypothetical protein
VDLDQLTERGLRDQLTAIKDCRGPLIVRLQSTEHQAALLESAANSLRKLSGFLDTYEDAVLHRLAKIEEKKVE